MSSNIQVRRRSLQLALGMAFGQLLSSSTTATAQQVDVSGLVGIEVRGFLHEPGQADQDAQSASAFFASRLRIELGRSQSVEVEPFIRVAGDRPDHVVAYFRELSWAAALGSASVEIGAQRIRWGVARLGGPIDVLNQKDRSFHPFSNARLGQPAVRVSHGFAGGTLELVGMSRGRARIHVGRASRLRGATWVDPDMVDYGDGAGRPLELAGRWVVARGRSHAGIMVFDGTHRDPVYEKVDDVESTRVSQRYESLQQLGVEALLDRTAWSVHLEAVGRRRGGGRPHLITVVGLGRAYEAKAASLDVTVEYIRDSRGDASGSLVQDEVYVESSLELHDRLVNRVSTRVLVDRLGGSLIWTAGLDLTPAEGWSIRLGTWQFEGRDVRPMNDDGYVSVQVRRVFGEG